MPVHKSVDEVVTAIKDMSRQEREELLLKMAGMDDIVEDLEDVTDILRRSHEPTRSYEDFLNELQAEGRDVQH